MTDAALSTTPVSNGPPTPDLPETHQHAYAFGLADHLKVSAERDDLRAEVRELKTDIALYKVTLEGKDAQLAEMQSRAETAMLKRDEAVKRRVEAETVLEAIMGLGRTFQIKNAPVVKEREEPDEVTIGGA